jgi:hypothetical protein
MRRLTKSTTDSYSIRTITNTEGEIDIETTRIDIKVLLETLMLTLNEN